MRFSKLLAKGDTNTVRLIGRWRSDIIMSYLYTSAQNSIEGLEVHMDQHGDYVIILLAHHKGDITPAPQVCASPRPSLVIGGQPGIGSKVSKHLNTPFTHQLSSLIASSNSSRAYNYLRRCVGIVINSVGSTANTPTYSHALKEAHTYFQRT